MKPEDIKKWTGDPVEAIVCVSTRTCLVPNPGSSVEHCFDCKEEIWLAESSHVVIAKYPTTPIICIPCAVKRGTGSGGRYEV